MKSNSWSSLLDDPLLSSFTSCPISFALKNVLEVLDDDLLESAYAVAPTATAAAPIARAVLELLDILERRMGMCGGRVGRWGKDKHSAVGM